VLSRGELDRGAALDRDGLRLAGARGALQGARERALPDLVSLDRVLGARDGEHAGRLARALARERALSDRGLPCAGARVGAPCAPPPACGGDAAGARDRAARTRADRAGAMTETGRSG